MEFINFQQFSKRLYIEEIIKRYQFPEVGNIINDKTSLLRYKINTKDPE
jgi:hypothetical protein